jgi:hypothetical protein
MTRNSTWSNHDIYYKNIGKNSDHTILARYQHFLSNFLFNVYHAYFFKSFNVSWRRLQLHALHSHRARSPTVKKI